ncbi:MAG: PhoX family phosphatase [Aquificaceae bacterium]
MARYIQDIIESALSRRQFLAFAMFSPALKLLSKEEKTFRSIKPNKEDKITVPEGFEYKVLISWGDALDGGQRLNYNKIRKSGPDIQDVERQQFCFGYNCDYVGFLSSEGRSILAINHEYCNPELMFPEFSNRRPTKEETLFMMNAHGVSIVEIKRSGQSWQVLERSNLNRRITANTPCAIEGPAKSHRFMKTSYDQDGSRVYGTINNCAGGKTPWGTVLTCEENFNFYFSGREERLKDQLLARIHDRYGIPSPLSFQNGFGLYEDRFNIEKEPNEAFRFGWVVEIDPFDPGFTPIKRTALGRFKHEAACCTVGKDGRVAVYMGDDERFEYVYKFVSKNAFKEGDKSHNLSLLDEGSLYVARFKDDLSGEWVLIASCEKTSQGYKISPNPDLPEIFKKEPELCFIATRLAADALNATQMDRPEDVEYNPHTRSVWIALTFNERRTKSLANSANPRAFNTMGHIIELREEDPTSTRFSWHIPLFCGETRAKNPSRRMLIYGKEPNTKTPPISAPDNFAIDSRGRIWIATDGNFSTSRLMLNDGVYVLDPFSKELSMFLSGVPGCEVCGPEFSGDFRTFFCAIQHPGESGSPEPLTLWPKEVGIEVPRPSVIAVWHKSGLKVG